MLFKRRFSVKPNNTGYLYKKNKLEKTLEPGIYELSDRKKYYQLVAIPTTTSLANIYNQEVLTKDNIALRFSFVVEYSISNPDKFVERFDILQPHFDPINQAEIIVHNYSQIYIREEIAKISSEELNEKKGELLNKVPEKLKAELAAYGIEISNELLKDVTFPKSIQNLFAKKLEAKIRAQADLENARSAVATARALKNASDLMKDDDNIRFIQFMETITKISSKGNHTFVLSDFVDKLNRK
ncbi:MAG: hypothetical protein CR968_00180 [Flavobacteriia bacterium]|nr:MAG: hypothetical protein CR968_00180 [Flavobacteriia bacterium]